MVRNIVGDISNKLFHMVLEDTSDIFGMDAHYEGLATLLNMGLDDKPRMIGIWGMGGIGKTTIAKCLYNKYKCQFPFHCFIENIKKFYNEHGREKLQWLFLSKILCDEDLKLETYEVSSSMVKARLRGLKVLVIFDDVDNLDQLEALAKEADWFGPGSRIIITTRDKGIQVSSDMGMYKAKCLGEEAALKLFNHFAFKEAFNRDQVSNDFANLSFHASKLVQGLPLALKVLGSFLHRKEKKEWEDAISRLSGGPCNTVIESLRVSYGGLDEKNKRIFLTVACLVSQFLRKDIRELMSAFNGEPINRLVQLLDGEEREIRNSLNMLAEKALVDISNDGQVTIHDLIQEMAKEIVYEQSPDDAGRRKFLWDAKEIYDVFEDGTGTDAIEGISLDFFDMPEYPTRNRALESIRNLKFLIIRGCERMQVTRGYEIELSKIREVFNHLPRKLKLLDWRGCPLTTLPSSFKGECLVELCLPVSNLEKILEGTLNLRNLKKMDLGCCSCFEEIPSLHRATKLEELYLPRVGIGRMDYAFRPFDREPSSWENWSQNGFLPSIMGLKLLKVLSLQDWVGLSEVPKSIQNFSALRELELRGCYNLKVISNSIGELPGLMKLRLWGCAKLKTIPNTIGRLTALEILDLGNCSSLLEIPNCIGNLTALRNLDLTGCENLKDIPNTIGYLTSLKHLSLSYCPHLITIPDTIGNLTGLQTLVLGSCTKLLEIPSTIGKLTALQFLWLGHCEKLENIPNTIGNLTALQTLNLPYCKMLLEIPSTIRKLKTLKVLNLRSCEKLENFPDSIGSLTALQTLDLSFCEKLESIPDTIENLTALETLKLSGCKRLSKFPSMMISLKNLYPPEDISCILKILVRLRYGNFSFPLIFEGKVQGYLERASGTQALEVLCIQRKYYFGHSIFFQCKSLSISPHLRKLTLRNLKLRDIPSNLGDLQVLQSLDLRGNDFEILPTSIKQLSLLKQLILCFCRNIRSLPELPLRLIHLYANGCSSLESISNIFNHPFEELVLSHCYRLGEFSHLFIQHMINSTPMQKGKAKMWACFFAHKVPNCFSHQSTEHKLTIPCARTDCSFKPVGFVAGVLITSLDSNRLSCSNIHLCWHGEGYPSEHMYIKPKSLPTRESSLSDLDDVLFVFSYNFGEGKSCDEISFHFNIDLNDTTDSDHDSNDTDDSDPSSNDTDDSDPSSNDTDGSDHECKIKGCGVQLCFTKELHQAQRQDIGKSEEYEKFSNLGGVHQPEQDEKLNKEEQTQPPNSKRRKFL